MKHFI